MSMNIKLLVCSISVILIASVDVHAQSGGQNKITKCQDDQGVWHYGSSNLYRCAESSKITTFNDRGIRVKEVDKVKTKEQIVAEKELKERKKLELEQQRFDQIERDRILTVYQNEADIESAREKKMIAYDRKIGQHKNYIQALGRQKQHLEKKILATKNRVLKSNFQKEIDQIDPKATKSEQRIQILKQEKIESNKKFDEDLEFFKKHKGL